MCGIVGYVGRQDRAQDVILDGPMPSPSGVLAQVSLELANATGYAALRERALAALNSGHRELAEYPLWNATPLRAMLSYLEMRNSAGAQRTESGRSPAGLMIH